MPKRTHLAVPPSASSSPAIASVIDRAWVADLLHDWLRTKSPKTLEAYQRDFADFAAFATGKDVSDADAIHETLARMLAGGEAFAHRVALSYKAHLMTSVAPRTTNRRLAALRSLVSLARLGWTLGVRGVPVTAVRDTTGVPRNAYQAMRSALEAEAAKGHSELELALQEGEQPPQRIYDGVLRPLRDLTILHLWHDMGLRRAAVWNLDVEDVDLRARTLAVVLKGKGTDKHKRPCPRPTCGVLKRYLAIRGREPGPLFYSLSNRARGKRLLATSYNKILVRIVQLAETEHANPHKFRHTAITRALDKGASIRDVAAFSGHADIRTVMIYDDNRGKSARQVAELVAADDDSEQDEDE